MSKSTPVLVADKSELSESLTTLAEDLKVLAFARQLVPHVLATGALRFNGTEAHLDNAIDAIARRLPKFNLDELEAEHGPLFKAVNTREAVLEIEDLFVRHFYSGQIAGYLLGLAVGQTLGPDALKGGVQ